MFLYLTIVIHIRRVRVNLQNPVDQQSGVACISFKLSRAFYYVSQTAVGICKIIPPRDFDRNFYLSDDFTFSVRHQKMRDHAWEHFGQNDLLFEVEK